MQVRLVSHRVPEPRAGSPTSPSWLNWARPRVSPTPATAPGWSPAQGRGRLPGRPPRVTAAAGPPTGAVVGATSGHTWHHGGCPACRAEAGTKPSAPRCPGRQGTRTRPGVHSIWGPGCCVHLGGGEASSGGGGGRVAEPARRVGGEGRWHACAPHWGAKGLQGVFGAVLGRSLGNGTQPCASIQQALSRARRGCPEAAGPPRPAWRALGRPCLSVCPS